MIGQCHGNGALFDVGVGAMCASNAVHKVPDVVSRTLDERQLDNMTFTLLRNATFDAFSMKPGLHLCPFVLPSLPSTSLPMSSGFHIGYGVSILTSSKDGLDFILTPTNWVSG